MSPGCVFHQQETITVVNGVKIDTWLLPFHLSKLSITTLLHSDANIILYSALETTEGAVFTLCVTSSSSFCHCRECSCNNGNSTGT